MDNREYDEEFDDELEEDEEQFDNIQESSEEYLPEQEENYNNYNSNQEFNKQNFKNKIRDLKKQKNDNQNAANRLQQRKSNTLNKGVEAPKSTPLNKKNNPLTNGAENVKKTGQEKAKEAGKEAAKKAGKAAVEAGKAAGRAIGQALMTVLTNPYVLAFLLIVIGIVMFVTIIWGAFAGDSSGGSSNSSGNSSPSGKESAISLTRTNLSKSEFVEACDNYAKNDSNHKFFYDKCDEIYEISEDKGFNPEMVVIRAISEGFSPGSSKNNYWGLGCYNGGGVEACITYSSFSEGVEAFIDNVSQYDTVEDMMGRYAYIGANWYNPGSSSDGGCYYFPYIKQYMSQRRAMTVEGACSASRYCSGTVCEPTNDEDQLAYSKWQVSKMVTIGEGVFGSVTADEASIASSSSEIPTGVDDLKTRYYFTFDKDSYLNYESSNNHLFAQCVWYAYHRAMDIVGASDLSEEEKQARINSLMSHSSDGGQYVTAMESAVFTKTTNVNDIKAPAVISWSNGSYGHVGIIEAIKEDENGNKIFVLSDGWRTRDCGNGWCTHNSMESLWSVTNFRSTELTSVSSFGGGTFVNAASLLE